MNSNFSLLRAILISMIALCLSPTLYESINTTHTRNLIATPPFRSLPLAQATVTVSPSPIMSPPPTNAGSTPATNEPTRTDFLQELAKDWPTKLLALLSLLFGIYQFRKSHQVQNRLEQVERERLNWERQKEITAAERKLQETKIITEFEEQRAREKKIQEETVEAKTNEEYANRYRERLISQLASLRILNMSRPLELGSVYVKLRVREEDPIYSKEAEIASQARERVEVSELLNRTQKLLVEKATLSILPEDALAKYHRIVILGDPGAGKTTTLRYLALHMAGHQASGRPDLPVYVELHRFVKSGMGNLIDYAASTWAELYGFPGARPYIEQQLDEGRAVLLLDGLDEVLIGESQEDAHAVYDRVAHEINRLATLYSTADIAVTCRRHGWRQGLSAFRTLEVLDFSWDQVQDFVKKWFKSDPEKAHGLRQELNTNLRMQTLAANPLVLSLIAIVYEEDLELPERRAALYERCVTVLLREWDSHRQIKRFAKFTTDRKQGLLVEIAWHFHRLGRRYFPEVELLQVISTYLPTIELPQEENKAILDEISAQYGLLKQQAHGWYGFLHLTFQEYFTAVAANTKGEKAIREVVEHKNESWWEEVILLLAGRMPDASSLLLGILGRHIDDPVPTTVREIIGENEQIAYDDDLFHSSLFLAAQCLIGTPRIGMAGLRMGIVSDVESLLFTSPYEFDRTRAAKALVALGDTAIEEKFYLILQKPASDEVSSQQQAIVQALQQTGDNDTARRLARILEVQDLPPHMRNLLMKTLAILGYEPIASAFLLQLEAPTPSEYPAVGWFDEYDRRDNAIISLALLEQPGTARRFFEMIIDQRTWPFLLTTLTIALQQLRDESLVPEILTLLDDERLEWHIKWLLTEVMESYREQSETSLRNMLTRVTIDERVRVGIAATIGKWGIQDSIPYLKRGIEDGVVQPRHLVGDSLIGSIDIWPRITRTLVDLGDSVPPSRLNNIVDACLQMTQGSSISDTLEQKGYTFGEGFAIFYAIAEYRLEDLSLRIARAMQKYLEGRTYYFTLLERGLPDATPKACIPILLDTIERVTLQSEIEVEDIYELLASISEVADDVGTVEVLQRLLRYAHERGNESYASALYTSLYRVTRQADVTITGGGEIKRRQ